MRRRLMLALAAYTLAVAALFGLFAMAFAYTMEDRFIERGLAQLAEQQRQVAPPPLPAQVRRIDHPGQLPPEVAAARAAEPLRREFAGTDAAHYHLWPLHEGGQRAGPWLLAEVSQQLIVRPMRAELLQWLALWGAAVVALALVLGAALARRFTRPLDRLAALLEAARAESLPAALPGRERSDEIGSLARSAEALLARTRDFLAREQAFTRDASHELRTPLTVLRLGLERLLPGADAAARPTLLTLRSAVLDMTQTLDTLLALAREGEVPHAATPTALLPLVEQWALTHADWLDEQKLELDVQLDRQQRLAIAPAVLNLVLANLLGNAFRHGSPGGQVKVAMDGDALCIRNPADAAPGEQGLGLGIVGRLLQGQGARVELGYAGGWTTARLAPRAGAGAQ